MKNFPKNFDPIFGVAVVKLRFHVAVAVGQKTARRGMVKTRIFFRKKIQKWWTSVLHKMFDFGAYPALRLGLPQQNRCGCGRSLNRNEFSIFLKLMLKTYKPWKQHWKCDCGVQRSCLKIKLCKKIVWAKNFAHFCILYNVISLGARI